MYALKSSVFVLVCSLAPWASASDTVQPLIDSKILSTPGVSQVCKNKNVPCMIDVQVAPDGTGCQASIDVDIVTVKKNGTSVQWRLVKTDMNDPAVYDFDGNGVVFVDKTGNPIYPQPDNFTKDSAKGTGGHSHWTSKRSTAGLNYAPIVKRLSPNPAQCATNDPTIVNNGG
jgi:hypothetical protein